MNILLNAQRLLEKVFPPKGSIHANPSRHFTSYVIWVESTDNCLKEIEESIQSNNYSRAGYLLKVAITEVSHRAKLIDPNRPIYYLDLLNVYVEAANKEYASLQREYNSAYNSKRGEA